MGALVPASTAGMAASDAPGAHYARQRIERVFDVGKNYASLLPLRARSEEAPGGHLPPAFCATALSCRPRPGIPAGGIVDAAGAGGRAQPEVQGMRRQGSHLRAHVGRERAPSGDRRQVPGGGSVRLW